MSSETTLLPRKWFAAAATFSLLLAGLAAFLLLAPHPREPGIGLPMPTTLGLRQRGEDGLLVPWGTTISGASVRIEVAGADAKGIREIELFLSQDGAPPLRLKHDGAAADLKQLAPGRYRWNAMVHLPDDVSTPLEPPRGDPLAADFVVAPPALELPPLQQRTLEGKEIIETGGKTRAGAKLGAHFPDSLPGAVLEIESKPAALAFDGSGARRIPVEKGDVSIDFAGPDGAYRWRARLVTTAQLRTEWRAFGGAANCDFVIFAAPTTPPSNENGDSGAGHDNRSDPANDNSDAGTNSKIPPNGNPNPNDKTASGKNSGNPGGNVDSNPNDKKQTAEKNPSDPSGKGDADPENKNKATGKNPDKPAPNGDPKQPDNNPDPKQNPAGDGKGTPGARAYSSGMGSGYRGPLPSRVRPLPALWHLALFRMTLIFGGIITALGVMLITMKFISSARRRPVSVP